MTQTVPTQQNDPFSSVRIKAFRNLLAGRIFFILALRMMTTVVGWWIYNLTNDPLAIGLIGLSEVIPAISLALYAGHFIDISEKRRLLLTGVMLYCIAATILTMLSSRYTAAHLSNHWIAICVYMTIFCTGIIRAFTGPVFNVMLASIVPKSALQNATTWNQGGWLSGSVSGHAIGGFLIAGIGISGTLTVIACLLALSFIILFPLKKQPPLAERGEKRTLESVKEGLNFVFKTKELLGALSLDMFAVLFGGAVAMVPVYARDILKVGPEGFGFLNGAADIGAICSVVLLTISPMRRKQGTKLLFAVAGFGTCIIIFAVSQLYWLSFAALLLSGMLDGISVVVRGTITQLKTPDHMRGRVLSVNSMFINSSNELGQFESGLAARLLGVVPSVVFGGIMTWMVVGVTWFKAPSLRKMEY
ncbi:MFS transporter [Deminuibacter soli]|uniref:MFS transporter n=1 Tax=Deminuibacter soli TaxID=2291815 RepID=A0A3E1NGX3_9BACT|nr:MFS transporter [Deminuibacter soli]RFM27206.1 MFS transporter [Deminuibacter soli]